MIRQWGGKGFNRISTVLTICCPNRKPLSPTSNFCTPYKFVAFAIEPAPFVAELNAKPSVPKIDINLRSSFIEQRDSGSRTIIGILSF